MHVAARNENPVDFTDWKKFEVSDVKLPEIEECVTGAPGQLRMNNDNNIDRKRFQRAPNVLIDLWQQ